MIFNKEYDKTLWLILSKNSDNRTLIINFLKTVPKELFDGLHEVLKNTEGLPDECEPIYVKVNKDLSYWYCVDKETEILEVGREFSILGEKTEIFHLILYPLRKMEYEEMNNGDSIPLGIIYNYFVGKNNYEERSVFDFELLSFDLKKSLLGSFKVNTNDLLRNRGSKYSFVNVKRELENFNINDLENKRSLRRVIIKKKRKNSR